MLTPLRYMNCKGLSILEQLCLEEVLLRKSKDNFVIYNTNSKPRSIVVGFSGKISELIKVNEVSLHNIPLIRRYTGGGTVITDNNTLFVTLILNSEDLKLQPYPREIMDWTSKYLYEPLFTTAFKDPNLKFSLRENDYTINDSKIGGNAQSITKKRFVHHTSFLWDFNQENMNLLQMPNKRPEYRQDRDHTKFLTTLKPYISKESFEDLLLEQLKSQFNVSTTNVNINESSQIMQDLLQDVQNEDEKNNIIRTKLENIFDYIIDSDAMKSSLVTNSLSCGVDH